MYKPGTQPSEQCFPDSDSSVLGHIQARVHGPGERSQVAGGRWPRAQGSELSLVSCGSDTALNMFPWVSVSSQTLSAGLRGTCPVQPAFSVLTGIRLGSLACSWTNHLGI